MGEGVSAALAVAVGAGAGAILGFVFFRGLWRTAQYASRVRRPKLLWAVSFVLRTTAVVAGFWLVGAGDWRRLIGCVLGWIAMRAIAARRWPMRGNHDDPAE